MFTFLTDPDVFMDFWGRYTCQIYCLFLFTVGANNVATRASARIEDPNFGSLQSPRLALGRALYTVGSHRLQRHDRCGNLLLHCRSARPVRVALAGERAVPDLAQDAEKRCG